MERPSERKTTMTVTKKSAATSQLETAITLWFNEGDPISIHALAVAANDCLHAMGKMAGKPSHIQTWLKSQPTGFQKRMAYTQNFIKHGFKDLHGKTSYDPIHGDVLMMDSVDCYTHLYGKKTPLMSAFFLRFALENPGFINLKENMPSLFESGDAANLAKLSRRQFLEKFLPALNRAISKYR
jgi:hypothetical protein